MDNTSQPPVLQASGKDANKPNVLPIVLSSAHWFWWIAGLSFVNSIISKAEGGTSFIIGLSFTQITDIILKDHIGISFLVDVLILGVFIGLGFWARRGSLSAFIIGGAIYSIDAFIYLYFEDWFPAAFHAYILFCLFKGAIVLWDQRKKSAVTALNTNSESMTPAQIPPVVAPVVNEPSRDS